MSGILFNHCIGEFLGTMLLVLLGNGVVAGVNLKKTFAHQSGWIVITLAWGLAVFVGVLVSGPISGAHLNPAVTIGLAVAGKFPWNFVGFYIVFQCLGALVGQLLVVVMYAPHYKESDASAILSTFCTTPAIANTFSNFMSEMIGSAVLIFSILMMHSVVVTPSSSIAAAYSVNMGSLGGIPVALVVIGIGLSLGATTGYAINPARDFAPRLLHSILPIVKKGSSRFDYGWIPVVAPLLGAIMASWVYLVLVMLKITQ